MAFPLALAGVKGLLSSWKVWVYVGLLLLSMAGAYVKGRESVYKENIGEVKEYIVAERERSAAAQKAAETDARELAELRNKAYDKLQELDRASEYDTCIPTDDQLRLLNEIAEGLTK